MNCNSGSILWLFSMQRSIRKTGFHGTWWSRGFTSILSKGWWGGGGERGKRVSALLYFQQLVFLDDCVTFRSSRISIYFQPEQRNFHSAVRVNPPSLDATSARPPVSPQFRRTGYRPFPPLRYLFIDGFAAPRATNGIKKTCDAHGSCSVIVRATIKQKKKVEKLRLGRSKLFETWKVFEAFFFFISSSTYFLRLYEI